MNQREICLVSFPYSDYSKFKIRPVIIVSNNYFNKKSEDVIVCGITSNTKNKEYSINISNKDLELGELHHKSAIKVESIINIDKKLFIKQIGSLNPQIFSNVRKKIISLFS